MSQIQVSNTANIIEPDTEVSYRFTSNTAESGLSTTILIPDSPIEILGGIVRINRQYVRLNKYYPFIYKGRKYLLFKPSETITEVYSVK